jgi:hypothetical protein
MVIVVAPPRAGSLQVFCNSARQVFVLTQPKDRFTEHVAAVFKRMKCHPILTILRKTGT